MSSHDLDQVSTASSLTHVSLDGSSAKQPRGSKSHASSKKSVRSARDVKSKWGDSRCCGATVETDDTNSITAGRHPIKSKRKTSKNALWTWMCQPPKATEMVNDEEATPLRTKKLKKLKKLKSPKPLRRGTSLFDTLEDEELQDYEEAQTTIAVVEVESMEEDKSEDKSVVTSASKWKLRLRKVRSIPKLGLLKVRSIPKLRSFKLGKKKKKMKDKEDTNDNDYILY